MRVSILIFLLLQILIIISCKKNKKKRKNIINRPPVYRYPNPGFVQDRRKKNATQTKPLYPDPAIQHRPQSFHPSYMDYCDPYHCDDYFKPACGLNRQRMKFQWFQSGCHLILNNKCANYRGFLKFDQVDTKYCRAYIMYALRGGCPDSCPSTERPVCAVSLEDDKPGVFRNRCHLYAKNCKGKLQQYVEVAAEVCLRDVDLVLNALEAITDQELKKNGENYSEDKTGDGSVEYQYYIK